MAPHWRTHVGTAAFMLATSLVSAPSSVAQAAVPLPRAAAPATDDVSGSALPTGRSVGNVAHRGAAREAPENTLAAVRQAIAMQANFVGIDVRRTRDGKLVVLHDSRLRATTNVERVYPGRASWPVHRFTYRQIRRLDAGSWLSPEYTGVRVPTLADVLEELSPSSTGAFLEIKQPHLYGGVDGIGIEVVRSIRRNTPWLSAGGPRDRLVVQAFNDGFLRSFARRHDNIVVGTLGPANRLAAYAAWADQVNVHHRDVTRDLVRSAHAAGLAVSTYVVNRRRRMDVVVSRGVDAISTDRPARLHGVLRRRSRVMEDPNAPRPPARASNAALTVRAPRRALLQTRVPLTARVRGSDGSRARWTWVKVQLKTPNRWRTLQRRVTDRRGNLRTTVTARKRLRLRVRSSATPWHTADGIRRSIDTEKADTRVRLYGDGRVRAGGSTRLRVRWRAEDGRRVSGRARLWARSGGRRWQPIRRLSVRRGARAVRVRVARRDTRFRIRARRGAWWTGDRDRHLISSIGR